MRAVRWHGRGDVRVEEVPDAPAPAGDEIRVAVEWCGICGTDLEEFREGPIVIPTSPHPLTGHQAPQIIGHEVVGRVADLGRDVRGLALGQLVALDGYVTCGHCPGCRRHQPNLCEVWAQLGMGLPGGLAEAVTVNAAMAFPATDGTNADALALAEPFSVAVRALRRGRLVPGERVAILGGGPIGLAVLHVAQAHGAAEIAVVEPSAARRRLASALGARTASSADELAGHANGVAADMIVDCTGHPRGPAIAQSLVRKGGRVVLLGVSPEPVALDQLDVVLREIELIGSVGHVYDEDFAAAVELIGSGRVDAAALVTHRVPLERTVTDGIQVLAGGARREVVKILVSPNL